MQFLQDKEYTPDIGIFSSHEELAFGAANEIEALLNKNPRAVLGMATGSTPKPLYEELVYRHLDGRIDFSGVRFFNLDEYIGLPRSHPQSYWYEMHEQFFNLVNANANHIHLPNGCADDIERECASYEAKIRAVGGIDLQILGIGTNDHIGFCMPGLPFETRTHKATLPEDTRRDNSPNFGYDVSKVPYHAISMGPATIMDARRIIMLANSPSKRQPINNMLRAPISPHSQATILRRHPEVKLYVDSAALPLQYSWQDKIGSLKQIKATAEALLDRADIGVCVTGAQPSGKNNVRLDLEGKYVKGETFTTYALVELRDDSTTNRADIGAALRRGLSRKRVYMRPDFSN